MVCVNPRSTLVIALKKDPTARFAVSFPLNGDCPHWAQKGPNKGSLHDLHCSDLLSYKG